MTVLIGTIQQRYGTAAQWTAENPTLKMAEVGYETDTKKRKTGDGVTAWNDLAYDDSGAGAVSSVNGQTGAVSLGASDVGADPAGSASAVAGNLSSHVNNTSNPHSVTKSQVGLSNVDNTSDANKPISTATQTALNAKQDRVSDLLTGGVITVSTIDGTGTLNDIRVTASTFYIAGSGNHSAAQTDFLNITPCTTGNVRWIGIYGTTSNTITKIEGSEGTSPAKPTTLANTFVIDYLLVTDTGVTAPTPSDSCYPIYVGNSSFGMADNTTYAFGLYNGQNGQPLNRNVIFAPVIADGTIEKVMLNFSASSAGSSASDLCSVNLIVYDKTTAPLSVPNAGSGSAGIISTTTLTASLVVSNHYLIVTGISVPVLEGNRIRLELGCPNFATNPSGVIVNGAIYVKRS